MIDQSSFRRSVLKASGPGLHTHGTAPHSCCLRSTVSGGRRWGGRKASTILLHPVLQCTFLRRRIAWSLSIQRVTGDRLTAYKNKYLVFLPEVCTAITGEVGITGCWGVIWMVVEHGHSFPYYLYPASFLLLDLPPLLVLFASTLLLRHDSLFETYTRYHALSNLHRRHLGSLRPV